MAQAEHDALASSTLFVTDMAKAIEVRNQVEEYLKEASRKDILEKSLTNWSKIIVVKSIEEAAKYVNIQAPEHLEIAMDEPEKALPLIKNAGAIFMGHYSAESYGDYMAGPNHVLPTVATAKFFSPLGVEDFIKRTSLQKLNKEAALQLADDVDTFAKLEGLTMHALSAAVRKDE